MSAIYAWLRRHQILVDSVLAAGLALAALPGWTSSPLWLVVTFALVVPVALRRRIPVTSYVIAQAAAFGLIAARSRFAAILTVLILLYTVAAYRPRRTSVAVLGTCLAVNGAAGLVAAQVTGGIQLAHLFVAGVIFSGIVLSAWVLGDSMRYRRAYYVALEERAAQLEAERDAQATIAAAAERARIARELHDVIAHHVSVMVVQADGAGYALRSDPDTARTALSAISATGRQALNEMRHLLGVLRTAGDRAQLAPVPGLDELRELLDQARTAGLAVSYTVSGAPRDLPEGAELTAYRVVQESLTNTRKHAGLAASAAITLRYEPDGLIIEVTDDGMAVPAAGTSGHGLAGMRERVAMYGGTVHAGPMDGGGFRVIARIPCPADGGAEGGPGGLPPGRSERPRGAASIPAGWTAA